MKSTTEVDTIEAIKTWLEAKEPTWDIESGQMGIVP
jgi:hypothetical protein